MPDQQDEVTTGLLHLLRFFAAAALVPADEIAHEPPNFHHTAVFLGLGLVLV